MKKRFTLLMTMVIALCTSSAWGASASYVQTATIEAEEATLSFADKAQRTSYSTEQQVWEQDGITFINSKAKSTNAVADYANPVRLYKGSSVTVTIKSGYEMTGIVFVSDAKYKTALEGSLTASGYEYTNSGNNYTVALDPATKSFNIVELTAQARLKSLSVSYVKIGGEDVPVVPEMPKLTSSCRFLEEQEVVISCSTEGATIYYTMDGTDPTVESTVYSEPFTVYEATTVKAFAVNEVGSSDIVEATYTKAEYMNIAGVVADGEQNAAITSGTVVATYAKGFLIGDDTGYILTYLGKESGLATGDVVTVAGATSLYGGLLQFGNTSTFEKTGTAEVTLPEPEVLDAAAMDALVAAPAIKFVQYTGTLAISGNYYNVNVAGTEKAIGSIQYPAEGVVNADWNGKEIIVTGFVLGVSGGKYLNTMAVSVVATEDIIPEEPKTDYTDAIKNASVAENAEWEGGLSHGNGGLYKTSAESFDFTQTIVLPAGQYKMTAQAAYRYAGSNDGPTAEEYEYNQIQAGAETHLAKLYAQTATYKYEVNVQNRWEGASETNYAGDGVSTVNGLFVPNSSNAVKDWFDNGMYVNELVFNVQEEGEVKIGVAKATKAPNGDYTNIGAWTLTRLGDAEADPEIEEPIEPEPEVGDVTSKYLKNAGFDDPSSWAAEGNVDRVAKEVTDWTFATSGDTWYYAAAVGYGSAATINNAYVPATDSEGLAEGGALGISVGWGCTVQYTQDVVLPAGVYTLTYKAINVNADATQASNLIGFKSEKASYYGNTTSFAANTWVEDSVTFVLKEETAGAITVGIGAISGGSGSNAKLFIDGVTLSYDPELPEEEPMEIGDVTSRFLQNADFEQASAQKDDAINTPPGWTLKHETSGWLDGSTRKSENPGGDGSQCYNLWAGTVTLADIYQSVVLPAGKYELTVGIYSENDAERYAYATIGGLTVKSAAPTPGSWDFVNVAFSNPTEGEVSLGVISKGWFQIDNVTLKYLGEVEDEAAINAAKTLFTAACDEFNAALTACQAQMLKMSFYEIADAADQLNNQLETVTDIEALNAMVAQLNEATASLNEINAVYAEYDVFVQKFKAAAETSEPLTVEAAELLEFNMYGGAGMQAMSIDALKQAIEQIKADYLAYAGNAKLYDGNMFDFTYLIQNPDFDKNVDGWTTVKAQHHGGEGYNGVGGIAEIGEWGASSWEASISQAITGLPNGKYVVKASWMAATGIEMVFAANAGETKVVGIGDQGGNIAKDGSVVELGQGHRGWQYVEAEGLVEDGALTIVARSSAEVEHMWSNADAFELYYAGVPAEPEYLAVVGAAVGEVALVEGAATVESISTIDVTFDRPVALAENAGWATLADSWGPTNLDAEVLADNNCVVRFTVSAEFNGEFTAAGEYLLNIPEGFIVGAEDASFINAAIEAVITIEAAPATPLTVVNVTVGEEVMADNSVAVAEVDAMIKVNFDGKFYFQGTPVIVDAEGNDASDSFVYANGLDFDGSNSYILMGSKAGIYTITLPKASFMESEMMGWKAPAEDIVLTVQIIAPVAEGKKVVYDLDVEREAGLGYTAQEYTIATSELAALLGVETLESATIWGVNPDGSYVADAMAAYDGWRAVDGTFAGWSTETAAVCVKLFAEEAAYLISICTHGGNGNDPVASTQSTASWALIAGIDTVVINTNITFVEPAVINIADFEVVSTITVNHNENAATAYSGNTAAFDPASAASALGVASLADAAQYILNVTTGDLVSNSTDGWRDVNGDAAAWGNAGGVCVKISDPASGTIDYIGCYDTTHAAGEVYTAKWAFVHEGKAVVIEVVITFVGENGIENIEAIENAVIYDLSGRRVTEMTKGIYIVNGKKVIKK